jgi:tRNA (guanine37-N1)-methyltransferase
MNIEILSVVPELLESPFSHSILQRARDKGLLTVQVHNLRKWAINKHMQIDDYQFGGGAGMVMMPEPLANAIDELQEKELFDEIIFLTPDGERFDQKTANRLSMKKNILMICGHYKGIDERIRQHYITREISIGDYVLSGGELAAMVVVDAVVRLLPGALGAEHGAADESFADGLLEYPQYTKPREFRGMSVPDVLLSGNHAVIARWRLEQRKVRTRERRPDLWQAYLERQDKAK